MKTFLFSIVLLAAAWFAPDALADPTMVTNAAFNPIPASVALKTNDTLVNPTISGQTNSDLTASLPVFTDANKALVSKTIAATKLAIGIQSGTTKADSAGKGTNTFATAFSTVPNVTLTRAMNAFSPSNTTSIIFVTATAFAYDTGEPGTTNQWLAIGAP